MIEITVVIVDDEPNYIIIPDMPVEIPVIIDNLDDNPGLDVIPLTLEEMEGI